LFGVLQYRGNIYVHGIRKRWNAPEIDWRQMQENENVMDEVIQYLDTLATMINPGFNDPVSNRHPCKKSKEELHDDQQDYIELINKLQ